MKQNIIIWENNKEQEHCLHVQKDEEEAQESLSQFSNSDADFCHSGFVFYHMLYML